MHIARAASSPGSRHRHITAVHLSAHTMVLRGSKVRPESVQGALEKIEHAHDALDAAAAKLGEERSAWNVAALNYELERYADAVPLLHRVAAWGAAHLSVGDASYEQYCLQAPQLAAECERKADYQYQADICVHDRSPN